ncbi:MAG: hypothetical protein PT944_06575 [Actinomycetaceae bacterium]|nr:hypothetical protein [Arcanobacterium sp.]MDD7687557.1 hypothetical protein [Actinomycetaceae bacterium]MDY5273031.1 hypothetical protein [Arcanobacterium sp.]
MNETLYQVFSTAVVVAGVVFTVAVLAGIIWMIVKWRSPEVQDLQAPVRQYLLDDAQRADYCGSFSAEKVANAAEKDAAGEAE